MTARMVQLFFIFLASSTKYLVGLSWILVADYSFWEAILITISGAMAGVFFFAYAGEFIGKMWRKVFPKKSDKVKFSWTKRQLVKLRRGYGLMGIAFVTPLLSPPVGAIIASGLVKDKRKIFPYMLLSFTFWSFLICGLFYGFGININIF